MKNENTIDMSEIEMKTQDTQENINEISNIDNAEETREMDKTKEEDHLVEEGEENQL